MGMFELGDLCWAKMKGFSPWPAMIADPIKKMKPPPKSKNAVVYHCVSFFGTKQYAWIPETDMLTFEAGNEKYKDKKLTGSLKQAAEEMYEYAKNQPDLKRKKAHSTSNASEMNHQSKPVKEKIITVKEETPTNKLTKKKPVHTSEKSKTKSKTTSAVELSTVSPVPSLSNFKQQEYTIPKIGFLGLGAMGSIIVRHLMKADRRRQIMVWNRTPSKCVEFLKEGALIGKTPGEVTKACDIIFSCLLDPQAVRSTVIGQDGVLQSMCEGKGYVEMSTIDPETSTNIAKAIASKHGRYLEVPILGTRKQAEDATLVLLTAGDKELFKDCKSCFQDIGEHVFFLGDVGNASKMNLVINMVMGTCFAAVAEAMDLAEHAGISQKDAMEILERGELNCPAIINQGYAIINGQHDDANIPLEHMQKNLHLALKISDECAQPIPTIASVNEVFTEAKKSGLGKKNVSVLCNAMSNKNNIQEYSLSE